MSNTTSQRPESKRRRSAPLLWGSGALAAILLILGVNGTLSAWTTSIMHNDTNQVGTAGSVMLEETGPDSTGASVTCSTVADADNDAVCSQINKYGSNGTLKTDLVPGGFVETTVQMKNVGTGDATSLSVEGLACTSEYNTGSLAGQAVAVPADSLCSALEVTVTCTGGVTNTPTTVTLNNFAAQNLGALASGATANCTFHVELPADADAKFAGQTVTQEIVWTLAA